MTEEELLEVMRNFKWLDPVPVFYRLYYDENGLPLFYSMEDLPGNYLEITKEQYHQASRKIRVKNNKIVELTGPLPSKLVPSDEGISCHPEDVSIVVNNSTPHIKWKLKVNEPD